MKLRVLPAAALLAALAACGATPVVVPPSGLATSSASPAAAPGGDVTLAFAGDVHFTDRTARLLSDPAHAFGPIASVLSNADLTMLNFESAVTARGTPQPKEFHFRTGPAAFEAVRAARVDVLTFANNHGPDYGQARPARTPAPGPGAQFPDP